ncbi:hypothetical protein phiPsa347_011 [Pseudomonas phage phiPsa347]|uniref:Uncharacterized protein n=2 Tax=Otagovirus TaxID=2560197 RepID=A0A7G9V2L9_9CAUD|nr:hypothetical protein QGX18_gp011 [Pseudomonas phage phiPsa347]QNO00525.1 hypothetical protein phiPsa347_011 [Pseudomonas phage phiPsa347]
MEPLHTPKVCNICGAEEPLPWFEAPMNETIREYARKYISPVKTFNTSLWAELTDWGLTEGLDEPS